MIFLDSSVVIAHLLAEDRTPPDALWQEELTASRLLQYEVWNKLNARHLARSHGEEARTLIDTIALIELSPAVLERALEPFPTPVRTLDSLHLASIEFLRQQGQAIELASYDKRLTAAARALSIAIMDL
ncbi:MAG: PIN domain-containing protein [Methyloceanibacter sp.]|uniref:PIN domain-containing protein n=1 Tax=Methyloceanibacter sp. TaxID=1965321 RepID=UPI003D6D001B